VEGLDWVRVAPREVERPRARTMTAVETAGARLARTAAKRATPKRRIAEAPPRHDDSGARSALESVSESALPRFMMTTADALPDDVGALRALILAEHAERAQLAERNAILERLTAKLAHIVAELKRAQFGRKSERITDDQLALALDELETAAAKANAEAEKADPERKAAAARKRRASRDEKLDHLPHEEVVIEPESKVCPCCGGALHVIGEDTSKRLDKVPAALHVIVTRRPKYACRTCERTGADEVAGIVQAPAPARLIEGGLSTEALVADVVVSKYADHLPLYRQSQIWRATA
jgi:transposase